MNLLLTLVTKTSRDRSQTCCSLLAKKKQQGEEVHPVRTLHGVWVVFGLYAGPVTI